MEQPTAQLYLFPKPVEPIEKPKRNLIPFILGLLFMLGVCLAVISWSLAKTKPYDPCLEWKLQGGVKNCVKWSGGEKVLK